MQRGPCCSRRRPERAAAPRQVRKIIQDQPIFFRLCQPLRALRLEQRRDRRFQLFSHGVSPVLGVLLLSYALWSTNVHAKVLGAAWMLGGLLIAWVMRRRGAPSLTWTD